jgi:hypothetical protein
MEPAVEPRRLPAAEPLRLPAAYGSPSVLLPWVEVEARLRGATHYWLATVRSDGRPHAVPVDGLWIGGRLVFSGDPDAVHERNLTRRPEVSVHLEQAEAATILEGRAERHAPTALEAHDLACVSKEKYGYAPPKSAYQAGVWRVSPRVVLAWTALYRDATRFTFG